MRTESSSREARRETLASRARRAQIIQTAGEVVAELGYANASVARIAERVGVSKGVITYHFDSKDEILRLVAKQLFERCRAYLEEHVDRASGATGELRSLVGAELDFFGSHRTQFIAMGEVMANHRDPDFSHAFEAVAAEEVEQLADLLDQGQRSGEFRAFDPDRVARIIYQCKNGVLDAWAHDPQIDLRAHAESLQDFIDHAIGFSA